METMKTILQRKSQRNFCDKQISDADLEIILKAAFAAPVGHGEYNALHLTVLQDADIIDDIRATAVDCFRDPILDIYYGAQTVIIISTKHGSVPELDSVNAGTIAQNMMLAATDLSIESCYIWGTVLAMRAEPDYIKDVNIPDGYEPIGSIALGYAKNPTVREDASKAHQISVNRV